MRLDRAFEREVRETVMLSTAHFSFTVRDLERSVSFYRETLGMDLVGTMEREGEDISRIVDFENARLKIAFLELPRAAGVRLELIEYLSPRGNPVDPRTCNPGSAHICFNVEEIHAAYDALRARGARFKSEPVEIKTGINRGGYAVYFLDPDDNTLELVQPPRG
ncbi:MAG: VOC family protein [Chloroflexota bacterium]